jgi:hypothetical protein
MDALKTTRISKKAMTAGVIVAAILGGGVSEASGLVGSANSRTDANAQVSSVAMLDATLTGLTDLRASLDSDTNVRTHLNRGGATASVQATGAAEVAAPAQVTILGSAAADLRANSAVNGGSTVEATLQSDGDTSTPKRTPARTRRSLRLWAPRSA